VTEAEEQQQHTVQDVTIRKDQIVDRQGRQFVLYAGLLDAAHRAGLMGIRTSLVDAPSQENRWTAIASAEVQFAWGVFTGIGDANAENVGRLIAPHIVRMAETRAKARALRDGLNVGMAALEELGADDDGPRQERSNPAPAPRQAPRATVQAEAMMSHPTAGGQMMSHPTASPAVAPRDEEPVVPGSDDDERFKYERLFSTASRLGIEADALPDDATRDEVVEERNRLLKLVNDALARRRPASGSRA